MVIDGTVDIAVICVSLLQVRTVIFQILLNEYSIYIVLRGSLEEAGFDENFLYQNLIGVAADMLVHILRQIPVAVLHTCVLPFMTVNCNTLFFTFNVLKCCIGESVL